jgi:hypothetical protein
VVDLHVGDIAHQNGRPIAARDDSIFDVLDDVAAACPEAPHAADHVLLVVPGDVAAADVLIAFPQRLVGLIERKVVVHQPVRVEPHVVLLHEAAERVGLHHALHRAELGGEDPILHRAELPGGIRAAVARLVRQGVLVHLSQGRRQRPQPRLGLRRQVLLHLREALGDEATDEIRIHVFLKHERDDAQAKLAQRAVVLHPFEVRHARLDGVGHQLLHLDGRHARHPRKDLHLIVRELRIGVHRHLLPAVDAPPDQYGHEQQNQDAVLDDRRDETVEHNRAVTYFEGRVSTEEGRKARYPL